jgi:hypothetical protein
MNRIHGFFAIAALSVSAVGCGETSNDAFVSVDMGSSLYTAQLTSSNVSFMDVKVTARDLLPGVYARLGASESQGTSVDLKIPPGSGRVFSVEAFENKTVASVPKTVWYGEAVQDVQPNSVMALDIFMEKAGAVNISVLGLEMWPAAYSTQTSLLFEHTDTHRVFETFLQPTQQDYHRPLPVGGYQVYVYMVGGVKTLLPKNIRIREGVTFHGTVRLGASPAVGSTDVTAGFETEEAADTTVNVVFPSDTSSSGDGTSGSSTDTNTSVAAGAVYVDIVNMECETLLVLLSTNPSVAAKAVAHMRNSAGQVTTDRAVMCGVLKQAARNGQFVVTKQELSATSAAVF